MLRQVLAVRVPPSVLWGVFMNLQGNEVALELVK